jgi:hypothetical protein
VKEELLHGLLPGAVCPSGRLLKSNEVVGSSAGEAKSLANVVGLDRR